MNKALSRAGAVEMVTPREIIRDYLTMLSILKDNPDATFAKLVSGVSFASEEEASAEEKEQSFDQAPTEAQPKKKIGLFDIDI